MCSEFSVRPRSGEKPSELWRGDYHEKTLKPCPPAHNKLLGRGMENKTLILMKTLGMFTFAFVTFGL